MTVRCVMNIALAIANLSACRPCTRASDISVSAWQTIHIFPQAWQTRCFPVSRFPCFPCTRREVVAFYPRQQLHNPLEKNPPSQTSSHDQTKQQRETSHQRRWRRERRPAISGAGAASALAASSVIFGRICSIFLVPTPTPTDTATTSSAESCLQE